MSTPLISVIVPVYKVEPYLRRCLDSLVGQTYRELEIILVDDGSPDGCGRICDEYAERDGRIKVIHQANGGVSAARNTGLDAAKGQWISFVDPDDWLDLDAYGLTVKYARETGADMVLFDIIREYKGTAKEIYKNIRPTDSRSFYSDLEAENTFRVFWINGGPPFASVVRANCLDEKTRFCVGMTDHEDTLFRANIYRCIHSFAYLPCAMYHYTVRDDSACHNPNEKKLFDSMDSFFEMSREYAGEYDYPKNFLRTSNSVYLSMLGVFVSLFGKGRTLREVKRITKEYMDTPAFREASADYDREAAGETARTLLWFKKFNMMPVLFIYYLQRVKRVIDTVKNRIDMVVQDRQKTLHNTDGGVILLCNISLAYTAGGAA